MIIDDGSTDATNEIVAGLARGDARIRILPAQGNRGQKQRLIELIDAASGEMLAFADQDDVWKRDKIARFVIAIGPTAMAFGRSELIDMAGTRHGHTVLDLLSVTPSSRDRLEAIFHPMVSAHAAIVRRNAVNMACLANDMHPFDWLMGLDALFSRDLVYVDDAVVFHRMHDANQNNGSFGDRVSFKRWFFRNVLLALFSQTSERLHALSMFDYLGKPPIVSPEVRETFTKLSRSCRWEWFTPWRDLSMTNAPLRDMTMDTLQPLAGSADDWTRCRARILFLTRNGLHPGNLHQRLAMPFSTRQATGDAVRPPPRCRDVARKLSPVFS